MFSNKHKHICYFLTFFCWFINSGAIAQDQKIADSLARIYQQGNLKDTNRLALLSDLAFNEVKDLQQAVGYAEELIALSQQTGNENYLRAGYFLKGTKKRLQGKHEEALDAFFKSAEIAKKLKHLTGEGDAYSEIGNIYSGSNNHTTAMIYYHKAITTLRQSGNSRSLASALLNVGDEFLKREKYDSALLYCEEAKLIFDKENYLSGIGYSLGNIGMAYAALGTNYLAEKNMNEAISILEKAEDYQPICDYLISIADIYLNKANTQAALSYTIKSQVLAEKYGLLPQESHSSFKLSELYEKTGNYGEALKHYKKHILFRDSINNPISQLKMADRLKEFEVAQKQAVVQRLEQDKRNKNILAISMAIIIGLMIFIVAILLKYNRNKQKAYANLNLQKQETEKQKAKTENALAELQSTQKQLIQTAKMASLGELTAGIAHEIQNPLNFVNNFSELSVDLLTELKNGMLNNLSSSDKAEALELINVLEDNFKKIADHGKRADSIVKGMLQHSKASTGHKESTDINALAEEYLRLSYHGLRAKAKEFKSNFTFHLDESIGRIEVVPEDMGRVLMNLYNNAFFAVYKKSQQESNAFEPLVSVTTKKIGNKVMISVKDNGLGIPQTLLDKIFQPFFTTKPTGQGTGLGLSLSYDIIKAHGGEIKVETKEGEFAEFIIHLPVGSTLS